MSNPSLKEQLQALSVVSPATPTEKKQPKFQKRTPADKGAKQKPAWLEYAQYGVELLKAHFPLCFKDIKEMSPLKVGVKQDLVKRLGSIEDIVIGDKACMVSSLSYYVNSPAYHKTMVAGTARIDLDGQAVGLVTAEEAQYSLECRKTKLQKKPQHTVRDEKVPATVD